eukprot:131008-Alexandrium_andersonii.AAC.1
MIPVRDLPHTSPEGATAPWTPNRCLRLAPLARAASPPPPAGPPDWRLQGAGGASPGGPGGDRPSARPLALEAPVGGRGSGGA